MRERERDINSEREREREIGYINAVPNFLPNGDLIHVSLFTKFYIWQISTDFEQKAEDVIVCV